MSQAKPKNDDDAIIDDTLVCTCLQFKCTFKAHEAVSFFASSRMLFFSNRNDPRCFEQEDFHDDGGDGKKKPVGTRSYHIALVYCVSWCWVSLAIYTFRRTCRKVVREKRHCICRRKRSFSSKKLLKLWVPWFFFFWNCHYLSCSCSDTKSSDRQLYFAVPAAHHNENRDSWESYWRMTNQEMLSPTGFPTPHTIATTLIHVCSWHTWHVRNGSGDGYAALDTVNGVLVLFPRADEAESIWSTAETQKKPRLFAPEDA